MHNLRLKSEEMKSTAAATAEVATAATTGTQRERNVQVNRAAKQFDQHRQQYPHRDHRDGRRVTIGAYCARAHKRTKRMNQTIYDVLWVAAVFRFLYLFIILMR